MSTIRECQCKTCLLKVIQNLKEKIKELEEDIEDHECLDDLQ